MSNATGRVTSRIDRLAMQGNVRLVQEIYRVGAYQLRTLRMAGRCTWAGRQGNSRSKATEAVERMSGGVRDGCC